MDNMIELTDNQINVMTEGEAKEFLDQILDVQGKILNIEGKIRTHLFEVRGRKCEKCGAPPGYIRFRTDGTYFCAKCGWSTGGQKV